MSTLLANDFSFYDLSPQEAREGSILTVTQIQVIQNKLSTAALEFINVEEDTLNPMKSSLHKAALQGAIAAYRRILLESQMSVQENYDESKAKADLSEQQRHYVRNAYDAFKATVPATPSTLDNPTT